jgi:CubicO group peptidase (beta-lactamase class C family)
MRLPTRSLLAAVLAAATSIGAGAQTASPDTAPLRDDASVAEALGVVETWLEAQRAYEEIPGLSAAIVHDQEQVWSGAVGEAHRGEAASPGTLYSICSISKLFTSIAVMQLRDAGELALSDPVSEHLPWYRMGEAAGGSPPVTIEGILTHSAGLPRESDHAYWSAPAFEFPTRDQIIEGLRNQTALYVPWEHYQYSNLGLTLAGEVVGERSGMPYADYVRSRILEPLGLEDTRPEMPESERGRRLATGHSAITRDGTRHPVPFFQARGITPAAGFTSTVEDLGRFASWQFGLEPDDPVLSAHTLHEMQRVHYVDPGWSVYRGLGFGIYRDDDRTFVGHGGSCPGYRSQLLLDMDDRIAAVFMANASGVNTAKYVTGMYDLVAPALKKAAGGEDEEAGEGADEAGPRADAPPLDDYLGAYSVQPWGGEMAVVRWKGGLAVLPLPTDDPARALTRLEHQEGDTFRRVRGDDELGEPIVFERDDTGRVVRLRRFNNIYPRIR